MRHIKRIVRAVSVCFTVLVLVSACASSIKRVDPNTQTDLSGNWNDADVREVCEKLVNDFLDEISTMDAWKGGTKPLILVRDFKNETMEHLDPSIISRRMERAIRQSGRADFVAKGQVQEELRQKRQDQASWASEETAKAMANESGADFYLVGTVKSMEDRNQKGNTTARNYMVFVELWDLETSVMVWDGEGEIKKVIKRSATKL